MAKKLVKFQRNKNESEALAASEDNIIFFTKDEHSIVMGGEIYGTAGESLEPEKKQYLDKLYEDYIKSLFTVTSSVSKSTVVPGTEVTVTITVKNNGVNVSADTELVGTGILSGKTFTEASVGVYRTTVMINNVGGNSGVVTVVYSGITKTVSVSISCYNNIIYGWSENETITLDTDLRGKQTKGPVAKATGSYVFENTSPGYYYLMIPDGTSPGTSLGGSNPQGTEGPIPVFFTKQTSPVISGYTVFRIADQQAPSRHTINFT